ncbi:hypothetical protein PR202_ga07084 [Eleusine coracana subsp. coracana]|uniref:Uncharacterized protein n=1 Tax=Eleusine coracana subsp. coracana TaxID=191504 RepID=A0AAV5BYZ5_ELECO|nr:hypothetical protein PR202_ga07084 [Eleusine coracana subsp. coracana]
MVEMDGGVGVGAGGGGEAAAARRWRLADERCDPRALETDYVRRFHRHEPRDHQCSSAVAKHIKAPVHLVWSLVRRFDQPQLFKPFVSRCEMKGNIEIGSVREVNVKSGLPATRSTERLELLDDNEHILSVRFVGGDHRLKVCSVLDQTLSVIQFILFMLGCGSNLPIFEKSKLCISTDNEHATFLFDMLYKTDSHDGRPGTLVIESFVVDVPEGNTKDETCYFVEALLKCNLKSLAEVSERLVIKDQTEPLDR